MKKIILLFSLFLTQLSFGQNSFKFYENGSIKEESTFIDGKYQSSLTRYYENGVISYRGYFNCDGKEDGLIQYFFDNGQKEFEYVAIDGKPIGQGYYYYPNGELRKVMNYKAIAITDVSLTTSQPL